MDEFQPLLNQLSLPEAYAGFATHFLRPVAHSLDTHIRHNGTTIIGINGSQGSGKSTAAQFLKLLLEGEYGHRIAILSIDDFYHCRRKRTELAQTLHPLFATRGVPGTHDVRLAMDTIESLRHAADGQAVDVPRFDKAVDDRKPREQWELLTGPFSGIILEGWCVGAPPLDEASLDEPINELERREDGDGRWRKAYSKFLAKEYQQLFAAIDWLLMLRAPGFGVVYEWRLLQERKLAQQAMHAEALLNEAQLQRFIQHYQRLTEHCLQHLPERADAVIELDEQHQMTALTWKQSCTT